MVSWAQLQSTTSRDISLIVTIIYMCIGEKNICRFYICSWFKRYIK